jgi:hypothetical protein
MSERDAGDLGEAFLNLLPDARAYFTNGSWGQLETSVD